MRKLNLYTLTSTLLALGAGKQNYAEKMYLAVQALIKGTVLGFGQLIDGLAGAGEYTAGHDTFVALGVSLATLFMAMEIFSSAAMFRIQGIEDGIRVGMKFIVCKIVMENSDKITGAIYSMFFKSHGLNLISSTMTSSFAIDASSAISDGGLLGIGYVVGALILLIVWGFMFGMLVKMVAQIAGIIFEIAIHQAAAPVALSTLCNEQARSAGISFIKSYSAVCMQGLVISICFEVYGFVNKALGNAPNYFREHAKAAIEGTVIVDAFGLIAPIIGMVILTTAISRSSDITKRMFGV